MGGAAAAAGAGAGLGQVELWRAVADACQPTPPELQSLSNALDTPLLARGEAAKAAHRFLLLVSDAEAEGGSKADSHAMASRYRADWQVEHIFPVTPLEDDGPSRRERDFFYGTGADRGHDAPAPVNMLGNTAMLEKSLNAAAGNNNLSIKKAEYRKSAFSSTKILNDLSDMDRLAPGAFLARQRAITHTLRTAFGLPPPTIKLPEPPVVVEEPDIADNASMGDPPSDEEDRGLLDGLVSPDRAAPGSASSTSPAVGAKRHHSGVLARNSSSGSDGPGFAAAATSAAPAAASRAPVPPTIATPPAASPSAVGRADGPSTVPAAPGARAVAGAGAAPAGGAEDDPGVGAARPRAPLWYTALSKLPQSLQAECRGVSRSASCWSFHLRS
jgi:hypothetical protein